MLGEPPAVRGPDGEGSGGVVGPPMAARCSSASFVNPPPVSFTPSQYTAKARLSGYFELATIHDAIVVADVDADRARVLFTEVLRAAGVRGVVR